MLKTLYVAIIMGVIGASCSMASFCDGPTFKQRRSQSYQPTTSHKQSSQPTPSYRQRHQPVPSHKPMSLPAASNRQSYQPRSYWRYAAYQPATLYTPAGPTITSIYRSLVGLNSFGYQNDYAPARFATFESLQSEDEDQEEDNRSFTTAPPSGPHTNNAK
jgi:hypothetical protein